MKNIKALFLYGFLIWLIPFVISFFIFPIRESDRIFFETLMTLILAITTGFIITRYNKANPIDSHQEGFIVGIIWLGINLFLDFFVFIIGPFKMPPITYLKEIGLDYLIIPTITTTIGILRRRAMTSESKTHPQA